MEGAWLSIIEYAQLKDISISTIRRYIKANRIKFRMEKGKYYIFAPHFNEIGNKEIPELEKEVFDLKVENRELKRINKKIQQELDEINMLIQIYERSSLKETPPPIELSR